MNKLLQLHLFIVIAVHNRKKITLNCIKQLKSQLSQNFTIIVVDDGSSDGTWEAISSIYDDIKIIRGEIGNWWWTKSVNIGIVEAINLGATHVLLLNDDTFFEVDYIDRIYSEIKLNPDSIIGSLNLTTEYPARSYFSGVKKLNKIFFSYKRYKRTLSVYNSKDFPEKSYLSVYLPARGLLVPVKVFQHIGILDEMNFPQYFSDVDFTLRAFEYGIPQFINHNMVLKTSISSTGSGDFYKGDSFMKFFMSFKNPYSKRHLKTSFLFIKKHVPIQTLYISFICYQIRIILSFFKSRIIT